MECLKTLLKVWQKKNKMRYRKTFTEAVKEVWAKAAKKKEEEKPVADEKPTEKHADKPTENKGADKDKTIELLRHQVGLLKAKLENEKRKEYGRQRRV